MLDPSPSSISWILFQQDSNFIGCLALILICCTPQALSPGQVQGNARPKITIEIPYPARNEAPESTDRDHPARIASSTDIQSVLWGSGPCDQGPIRFRKDSSNTSLTSESGRSPPRSPVSGLVQRTRASISSILGLNSKPSALALKNNTFSPSPRLEYLNCYGEEPFSLAYQRCAHLFSSRVN